jgi:hypothetical protein
MHLGSVAWSVLLALWIFGFCERTQAMIVGERSGTFLNWLIALELGLLHLAIPL